MNPALLKSATALFNDELHERMDFNAVRFSPTLLHGMMQAARAENRHDIALKLQEAIAADDNTPAHRLYHREQESEARSQKPGVLV